MRRLVSWVVVALFSAGLLAIGAPGAGASSDLALTGFADMVLDEGTGHIFISDGVGQVLVTDLAGNTVTSVGGLPGAHGLTLSGDTVYVALRDGSAIASIDTTTLAQRGLPVVVEACPTSVAVAAGLLWYSAGCADSTTVGAVNTASGSWWPGLVTMEGAPLWLSKGVPGRLFVMTADRLAAYSVAATSPSGNPAATRIGLPSAFEAVDLAVSDSGHRLLAGAKYYTLPFRDPLDSTGNTHLDGFDALGSGHGLFVAAAHDETGTTLKAYSDTTFWGIGDWFARVPGARVPAGGLAMGAITLYAVAQDTTTGAFRLVREIPRYSTDVDIDFSKPNPFPRAGLVPFEVSGTRGSRVDLYVTDADDTDRYAGSVILERHDRKQTVKVRLTTHSTVRAVIASDVTHEGAVAKERVLVAASLRGRLQGATRGKVHAGQRVTFRVKVLPRDRAECLRFRLSYYESYWGEWAPLGKYICVPIDKRGRASVYATTNRQMVGFRFRFEAWYQRTKVNVAQTENSKSFRVVR